MKNKQKLTDRIRKLNCYHDCTKERIIYHQQNLYIYWQYILCMGLEKNASFLAMWEYNSVNCWHALLWLLFYEYLWCLDIYTSCTVDAPFLSTLGREFSINFQESGKSRTSSLCNLVHRSICQHKWSGCSSTYTRNKIGSGRPFCHHSIFIKHICRCIYFFACNKL